MNIENGPSPENQEEIELDSGIEEQKSKLEDNLNEFNANSELIENSDGSFKEKVLNYLSQDERVVKLLPLITTAGMAMADTYNGNYETALVKLGVGATASAFLLNLDKISEYIYGKDLKNPESKNE